MRVGHGQMRERELEQLMLDFYHRRFNLLVCTTIIESGIDVPTANTIVIDRADRFGLAQLHQLRGRVGRSHHRAYAYLITPPRAAMSGDAVKRLEAIESLEDLGAGFVLATHDLEIRGAGELLGEEQSGQIQEIGFSLYMELLDRAVQRAEVRRRTRVGEQHAAPARRSSCACRPCCPEHYVADVHLRLTLYKRVSGAPDDQALDDLQAEMIDRFGPLPGARAQSVSNRRAQAARTHAGYCEDRRQRSGGLRAVQRRQRGRPADGHPAGAVASPRRIGSTVRSSCASPGVPRATLNDSRRTEELHRGLRRAVAAGRRTRCKSA